ncbi:radical SAM protein [Candidatus Bathyarchaeota archaeon]|nr:radical SAM protein [Candidatus Bathyarchaeota archaeon]
MTEADNTTGESSSERVLRFYYPQPSFPAVSVTGGGCALNCKHCGGHYLEGMADVSTPEKLKQFCVGLEARGGAGLLVSGGSTLEGRVPLRPFLPTLEWVKENTDLIVNLHTGMLDMDEAEEIAATGVDIVSVDVVGSDETLKEVYGLDASVEDYGDTLKYLEEAGVPTVAPHVCVGLHFGELRGELRSLDIIGHIDPEVIVFLGLIPTPGTEMADVPPPEIDDVIEIIAAAVERFPRAAVSLGCMRSRQDKEEMERRAIEAGASRIAVASRSTLEWARERGYAVKVIDGCCTIPERLEGRALRS